MKILYTLNSGKPGGMEKHVLDLVKGMKALGHEVFVWCPQGEVSSWYREAGAIVTNKKIWWGIDPVYFLSLKKYLTAQNIEVLHAHELKAVCNSLIAAKLAGTKVIISHTHTPISTWKINEYKKFVDRVFYTWMVNNYSHKEIALTNSALRLKEKEGIKSEKLVVIPNAINTKEFEVSSGVSVANKVEIRSKYKIPADSFVFGCVGRLTEEKGQEVAIKAFKIFSGTELFKKKNFYLLIVGGGQNEEKLKTLSQQLGIADRVIITGIFNREDLVKYYNSFDTFIFPSLAEGFGYVLIEAMYCRLPVISSNLEVLREVGGSNVTYFKTGSDEDLAKKMEKISQEYYQQKDFNLEENKKRVENLYSMNKFVQNYINLYTSLAKITMKVLILGRIDLFEKRGGDTVQIENTLSELKKMGLEAEVKTDLRFDPEGFDLVHVFQLDWIPEMYFYVKRAVDYKKPVVLSPIHHNVNEVKKFDDEYVFDFRRISKVLFQDQFSRDTFKNLYRSLYDHRRLMPTLYAVFHGFKNMQKKMLEWSKIILVQTQAEARDLQDTFQVKVDWVKVPNGVSKDYLKLQDLINPLAFNDYVISVGRIEPRKNQLNIISAVKKLREETGKDIHLVFIGNLGSKKHMEYTKYFCEELKKNDWITHLSKIPYEKMPAYYKFAKVCVSASWFETTGLTSLEALFCGTNAVASGERAKECLGNYASYCSPDNVESIKQALKQEFFAPRPQIDEKMRAEYTWENTAKKTLEVYKKVLGK